MAIVHNTLCLEDKALKYVPQLPQFSSVAAHERADSAMKVEDICDEVMTAKKVALEQLIERVFTKENTLFVAFAFFLSFISSSSRSRQSSVCWLRITLLYSTAQ